MSHLSLQSLQNNLRMHAKTHLLSKASILFDQKVNLQFLKHKDQGSKPNNHSYILGQKQHILYQKYQEEKYNTCYIASKSKGHTWKSLNNHQQTHTTIKDSLPWANSKDFKILNSPTAKSLALAAYYPSFPLIPTPT